MSDPKLPRDIDPPPFYTRYGFSRPASTSPVENDAIALTIEPYESICSRGRLRPTILASAVDLVSSLFVREQAGLDVTFTSDLSLRVARPIANERVDVRGRILRSGKRTITVGVDLEVSGARVAYGESSFTRMARRSDPDTPPPTLDQLRVPATIERNPLAQPLADEVGIERLDAGLVRLELHDGLRNPEGVLQGALVALIVECAAEPASPDSAALTALDLRYLSAARTGPVIGRAIRVSPDNPLLLRVDLHDAGADHRLTTTALVGLSRAAD